MKAQDWLISIRYAPAPDNDHDFRRRAVVGPACAATVEAVLRLVGAPAEVCAEVHADATVRKFVEGALDPEATGYYAPNPYPMSRAWVVCIGSVHEVIPR